MKLVHLKHSLMLLSFLTLIACSGEQTGIDTNNSNSLPNPSDISGIESEYSAAEVQLGKDLYEIQCLACHGDQDEAGPFGAFFVEGSKLTSSQEYIQYISEMMPIAEPLECDEECATAIFSYAASEFLQTDNSDSNNSSDNSNSDSSNSDNSNSDNSNNNSDSNTGTVVVAPIAPNQLTAQLVNNAMAISWNDASNNETGFVIERRILNNEWTQLAQLGANITSYNNILLDADTTYEYRLHAFNDAGMSDHVTVIAAKTPAVETGSECTSPQYVAGTAYTANQLVSNASNTYQCKIAGWCSSSSALHYAPGTGINWQDAWTLSAASDCDTSTPVTIPASASSIQASALQGQSSISITWTDNSDNELGYVIERKQNSDDWISLSELTSNTQSYSDMTISAGNEYQYRVAPFNTAGTASFATSSVITLNVIIIEPDPDNEADLQAAYDDNCTGCHTASGGIGGNLLDDRVKASWSDSSFSAFVEKVQTMQTLNCDAACQEQAATYLWVTKWNLSIQVIDVTDGRGARGIRLLSPAEYQNSIEDLTGVSLSDDELPSDFFDTEFKYPTQSETGVVLYESMNKYYSLAQKVAESATMSDLGCSASCTNAQVSQLGLKIFRRPLTAAETATYTGLNSSDGSREMLTSMLISPYFLYKIELGTWNNEENAYELNSYELATSLAYMLWGTTPDTSLLTLAQNNGLSTDAAIDSLVDTMMDDDRFAENMSHFVKYYSNSYQQASEKPNLNSSVIDAMYEEQSRFIDYWLNGDDASFYKLFNPGYTFVNSTLANHYEISVNQTATHKVNTLDNRGGLLHQGLTQIMNSDFAATSLVKRGKMIRENMLCHTMGVPSGVDPSTIELPDTAITTRERWNIITGPDASEGQCWECHQLMNEPGSSLEQFDAAGRFRTTEQDYNGSAVNLILDVTGTLRDSSANSLVDYADARELTQYLGQSSDAKSCFTDNFVRYATGHETNDYNKEELSNVKNQFDQDDNVKLMIKSLAKSTMMRYRVEQ